MVLPTKTRAVVIDDHAIVVHGLTEILKSEPNIEVCGEASNGHDAIEIVRKIRPDLALTDLTLSDMEGTEIVEAIREASPETAILVLTMHSAEELVRAALRAGAHGYVVKSEAATELIAAVRSVQRKQLYLTPQMQEVLIGAFVNRGSTAEGELPPARHLSSRETEIVQLLVEGRSNKQVAATLGLSLRTVESHRYHIMRKMHFSSFSDLVRFALRERITSL